MTLVPDKNEQSYFDRLIPNPTEDKQYSFSEKAVAAFQTENTLGAWLAKGEGLPNTTIDDPAYNPWNDLTDAERIDEPFVNSALLADSKAELEAIRKQTVKERANREKLTGVSGTLLAIGAGVVDPINLVPIGGSSYRVYRTGESVLKGALRTSAIAAGSAAISESILQSQQLERTMEESALNVTGAALLGLVFGGAAGKLSKAKQQQLVSEIEEFAVLREPQYTPDKSVGAAQVTGEIRVKGAVAEKLTKILGFDPLSRILTSRSNEARKLLAELAENPIELEVRSGNPDSPVRETYTGTAVESLAKIRRDGLLYRGMSAHIDSYRAYKKEGGRLRRKQFNELVAKEIRNPGTVQDSFVKQSAEAWKRNVYDPQFNDIVAARLLPEDVEVTTAKQYLNRVWNKEKVASNLPEFVEVVGKWLGKRQPDLDADDIDSLAQEIAARIMSTPDGMLPYDYKIGDNVGKRQTAGLKGPFKQRVFDIEDSLVEKFLENDIEMLAGRYLRQTSTDIELVNRFGDPNTPPTEVINMTAQKKTVNEEYGRLIRNAKNEKERAELNKERNRILDDIQGIVERMRGTYEIPDPNNLLVRMLQSARNLNFLRFMGGVTISSFPDAARVVMSEGVSRAFGTTFRQLIKGLKSSNPAAEDVKYWGVGTDAITGGRLEVISDINDYALGGTKFERGLQSLANSFGNINLMNQWTSAVKTIHAISMQSRFMDMKVYDKRLGRLGISEPDFKQIQDQVKRYGRKDDKAWIFNTKNWDRSDLALKWGAALKKESDRVIIVPGQEKPLFMSRETGKTLLQFRSFMLSATQRVFIAGIQGQDAHAIQGLLAMISIGGLTYAIKQWESGREISSDPRVWVAEGIDRSGALGVLMEINNTIEKISSNNLGLRPLMGISEPSSRFASRSVAEAALGPTYGSTLNTTLRVLNAASSDFEWTEGDTSAVRRMLPFQNLFVVRSLLDQIEEEVNQELSR